MVVVVVFLRWHIDFPSGTFTFVVSDFDWSHVDWLLIVVVVTDVHCKTGVNYWQARWPSYSDGDAWWHSHNGGWWNCSIALYMPYMYLYACLTICPCLLRALALLCLALIIYWHYYLFILHYIDSIVIVDDNNIFIDYCADDRYLILFWHFVAFYLILILLIIDIIVINWWRDCLYFINCLLFDNYY